MSLSAGECRKESGAITSAHLRLSTCDAVPHSSHDDPKIIKYEELETLEACGQIKSVFSFRAQQKHATRGDNHLKILEMVNFTLVEHCMFICHYIHVFSVL